MTDSNSIVSSRAFRLAAAALLCLPFAAPAVAQVSMSRPAAALIPETGFPLDPRFSADRVKADVAFLADDLLEGRDTGSVGYEIAARYVAQRFAALGLTPMGDAGGWMQQVTFQKTERLDAPSGVTISGPSGSATFGHGVDALVSTSAAEATLDVTAPLVFVGYGMVDKRLGLDDYAGLDVRGRDSADPWRDRHDPDRYRCLRPPAPVGAADSPCRPAGFHLGGAGRQTLR